MKPDSDAADRGTFLGALKAALHRASADHADMLPATVISYDRASNRAQVQPLVQLVTTEGGQLSRAPVASVPVLQLGGGGFVLSFPIKQGDLGWIKATDRDLTLFLQAYRECPPNTERLHSFEDSVFVPDVMTGYSIAGEDSDSVTLQTLDGSFRVALSASHVKITAGASTAEFTGSKIRLASALIELAGPVQQSGGTLTAASSLTVAGKELAAHDHGGIYRGSARTDPL